MAETADELRTRLKNERTQIQLASSTQSSDGSKGAGLFTTSSPSSDIERYSPDFGGQDQRDERPFSGLYNRVRGAQRTASDTQRKLDDLTRSAAQINQRKRRSDRRSSEDNGQDRPDGIDVPASPTGRSERSARTVGNLEALEPIPPRTFDTASTPAVEIPEIAGTPQRRKRGRPPKQRIGELVAPQTSSEEIEKPARKFPILSGGKTFTEREARELKEPLIAALTDEFAMLDKVLLSYTQDPLEQPIWSDITEKEVESLTNIILKLGQRSPVVATAARTAVDGADYVATAMILAPRFQTTVKVVREARQKKREYAKTQPRQSTISRIRERRQQAH